MILEVDEDWVNDDVWDCDNPFVDSLANRNLGITARQLSVMSLDPSGWGSAHLGRWLGRSFGATCYAPILCSFPIRIGSLTFCLTPILQQKGEDFLIGGLCTGPHGWYDLSSFGGETSRIPDASLQSGLGIWLNTPEAPTEIGNFEGSVELITRFGMACSYELGRAILKAGMDAIQQDLSGLIHDLNVVWQWYGRSLAQPPLDYQSE